VAVEGWLVDKSALTRLGTGADAEEWARRIQRGLVRIATVTRLEVGFSARSADELRRESAQPPLSAMPVEYATPAIEDRAVSVQLLLAEQGHHRAVAVPDLVVAATAELNDLTVLHLDEDFDLVEAVTGQPVERLVETRN
jgi:predicted nucleic acid-binding protein